MLITIICSVYFVCLCVLDVPIFPTITAIVTLETFEPRQTSAEKFLVPRDYKKFEVCFVHGICHKIKLCLLKSGPCDVHTHVHARTHTCACTHTHMHTYVYSAHIRTWCTHTYMVHTYVHSAHIRT